MGQYNKAVLTTAGEKLIARALAGEIKLNITKAKTSDFAYPDNVDLKRLTDMQGVRQTVCDPETVVFNETIIQTRVLFSNEDIASTYYIHNIGLYAMDGTNEVLFSIVTAEMPDEMPQYNGVASTSYIYNIQNVVQDAPQLNISVNLSGTATIQDVLERVDVIGGDISKTVIETLDTVEDKYPVPAAGESVKRFFGKVQTFLRNIRPLTGNTNIYVSTTGSDTTGDGSQLKPFKTIQRAIDIIPKDLNGFDAIINVAVGTYAEDVVIKAFSGGSINLYSANKNTLINTCTVNSINVFTCTSYVRINGFNISTSSRSSIHAYGSNNVYIYYCQSVVSAPTMVGIIFSESSGNVENCKFTQKDVALQASNSKVASVNWDSGSAGGIIEALQSVGNSIVIKIGTQPVGITMERSYSGGVFINGNGTQISGLITSGLSCTWGSLLGGYYRNGNSSGVAQVIINLRVTTTTQLTVGQQYSIGGFPIYGGGISSVAVTVHNSDITSYCYINELGYIIFAPKINLVTGYLIILTCTYITNS